MCALLPTNVREGLDMLPANVRERRVLRRRLAPLRHGERREVRHVPRRPRQPVAAARDESPPGREVDRDERLLVAVVRAVGPLLPLGRVRDERAPLLPRVVVLRASREPLVHIAGAISEEVDELALEPVP